MTGSHFDPEHRLIGQRQWQGIHDSRPAGQSVAGIARDLELGRKTVRSCLRQSAWRPYRRGASVATKLDVHAAWLAQRAPQVHYSARIFHRNSASSAASPAPTRPSSSPFGRCAAKRASPRSLSAASRPAPASRRRSNVPVMRERIPDLLAAHENAFAHFGGRCETLLYDRMRTVVIGSTVDDAGKQRPKLNTTFDTFARHWGFPPRLCQPYREQTKGKVESGVMWRVNLEETARQSR